jgi:uncharacterized lipoprotein YbaY
MKQSFIFVCIFVALFHCGIAFGQQENLSKRLTHAFINGEVRGNGSLPIDDQNAYLLVELRFSRDDRPQSIARTKIKLSNYSTTSSFVVKFKLRYPLSKISPHNTYILYAKIRNNQNKLLYIGDLSLPVTERREKQAKYLILQVIPTRKFEIE